VTIGGAVALLIVAVLVVGYVGGYRYAQRRMPDRKWRGWRFFFTGREQ
jgi:hypothetical protein